MVGVKNIKNALRLFPFYSKNYKDLEYSFGFSHFMTYFQI